MMHAPVGNQRPCGGCHLRSRRALSWQAPCRAGGLCVGNVIFLFFTACRNPIARLDRIGLNGDYPYSRFPRFPYRLIDLLVRHESVLLRIAPYSVHCGYRLGLPYGTDGLIEPPFRNPHHQGIWLAIISDYDIIVLREVLPDWFHVCSQLSYRIEFHYRPI